MSDADNKTSRGQKTKNALLGSVLDLVEQGLAFSAISLREVTRQAGVVPTSFYRHFDSMDELGLNLVDQTGLNLRKELRGIRAKAVPQNHMIRNSVELYAQFVLRNKAMFSFILRERFGGSQEIREAIEREISFFSAELASDLQKLQLFAHFTQQDIENFSALVVSTVANETAIILKYDEITPRLSEQLKKLEQKMMFIFLGAIDWKQAK